MGYKTYPKQTQLAAVELGVYRRSNCDSMLELEEISEAPKVEPLEHIPTLIEKSTA